jgi:hypothetical protein
MTFWTTTADAASTSTLPIRKTRMANLVYEANSLLPNSKFTFWMNGIDMTWACRQEGKRMGAGITSDAGGYVKLYFMAEINTPKGDTAVSTRYNMVYFKDINGNVVGVTVTEQTFVRK